MPDALCLPTTDLIDDVRGTFDGPQPVTHRMAEAVHGASFRCVLLHPFVKRGARRVGVCGVCPVVAGKGELAFAHFRDALIAKGLAGSSMTRVFGTVRSVFNFAAAEIGVAATNPFAGVYYDRKAGVEGRQPLPLDSIRSLQQLCRSEDDDLRWLVAMVSDTGMRLAEAAGLLIEDIHLDGPVPHVEVREHPWRRLKTAGSTRTVPLAGASLWAAQRILSQVRDSKFAFPRYNRNGTTNANSASAALNKWVKQHAPEGCTMHSFRHSMRDRL